jgi:hypothetical protein
VVRIASAAAIGRLADRLRRRKQVLTVAAALSGLVGSAYMTPLQSGRHLRVEAFNTAGSEAPARRLSCSELCCRANWSIDLGWPALS